MMREKNIKKSIYRLFKKNECFASFLDFLPMLSQHFNSLFSYINDNGKCLRPFFLFMSFHIVSLLLFDYEKSENSDNKEKAKERN